MRVFFACLAAGAVTAAAACGSSDSGGTGPDASVDASTAADAGDEDCLFCGSVEDVGAPQGDGSTMMVDGGFTSCEQMAAALAGYQAAAQACNSNLTMQCNGTTMGTCCPITVTSSNTQAVSDYDVAVAGYVAACTPDCSIVICTGPAPSHACVSGPMASGDVCE